MSNYASDFSKARVGDKVWSIQNGDTKIVSIKDSNDGDNYVIETEYETYTIDGKLFDDDAIQSLYWGKPEVIAPPMPEFKEEKTYYVIVFPELGTMHTGRYDSAEDCEKLIAHNKWVGAVIVPFALEVKRCWLM